MIFLCGTLLYRYIVYPYIVPTGHQGRRQKLFSVPQGLYIGRKGPADDSPHYPVRGLINKGAYT